MVSNIIYRAVPYPMEEVLTDSISDNDILHQYTSQIISKSPHIVVEPDDISICTMSTESISSEVTHVCIDSCDSLDKEPTSNAANLNKRKVRPKKAKKQLNNLTLDTINRVPLDVVYGNFLLKESTGNKQNGMDIPLYLSVTEMLDFDQNSQTDDISTVSPQRESIFRKRSRRTVRDNPVPKGKRKKITNHSISPRISESRLSLLQPIKLNQFSLETNKMEINRTLPPLSVCREMKLSIRKLPLKKAELKLEKLKLLSSETCQFPQNFTRIPMLNLQRIIQLHSI